MSCNNHCYESMLEELELESKFMRARMNRLESENLELQKQVDALLLVLKTKEQKRLSTIEEIWKNTRNKS